MIWRKNKVRDSSIQVGSLSSPRECPRLLQEAARYVPQMSGGHRPVNSYTKHTGDGSNYGKTKAGISGGGSTSRYPTSILDIPW